MSGTPDISTRIEYIDIAKGIGILLVVFGHVVWGGNYPMPHAGFISNSIYSFHMPLFFIISGLCLKETKVLDKPTIKKMAKAYLIPYAAWTIVYLLMFETVGMLRGQESIFNFENNLFAHAISICGVAPLWFLIALFIAEVITIAIKPLLRNRGGYYGVLILLVVLSIGTSIWYDSIKAINLVVKNYLMGFLRIFPTTFFVLIGYGIKDKIKECEKWKLGLRVIILLVLIGLQVAMCVLLNNSIDVQVYRLGNQWLYFPKAIIGSLAVLLFSQMIHYKWLLYLGSKTKEIMILHYPPFYWTVVLRFVLGKIFEPNIIGGLIITVVTVVGCLVIDRIMSRIKVWKFIMGK